MLDDNMVCLDDGVKITVLDETSPDWALAKGGAQDTSADLKARTVDVPTTGDEVVVELAGIRHPEAKAPATLLEQGHDSQH